MLTQQRTPEARASLLQAIQMLSEQEKKGLEKYGMSLMTWNGRDPLTDAMQEDIDRWQYMVQARKELAQAKELLGARERELSELRSDMMEIEDRHKLVLHQKDEAMRTLQNKMQGVTGEHGYSLLAALEQLQMMSFKTADEHGWWEDRPTDSCIPEKLCLMHSEISEALEEFRNHRPIRYEGKGGKPEGLVVELADVFIRAWDLAGYFQWPLAQAIWDKMMFNEGRPHKHGGKRV